MRSLFLALLFWASSIGMVHAQGGMGPGPGGAHSVDSPPTPIVTITKGSAQNATAGGIGSISATLANTTTATTLIATVTFGTFNSGVPVLTDSVGSINGTGGACASPCNTFIARPVCSAAPGGPGTATESIYAYYATNAPIVGTSHVFSVAPNLALNGFQSIYVEANKGLNPTAPFDKEGACTTDATLTATSISPGATTPTLPGSLAISYVNAGSSSTAPTINAPFTVSNAYAIAGGAAFAGGMAISTPITVSAAPTWSMSTAGYPIAAKTMIFKPADIAVTATSTFRYLDKVGLLTNPSGDTWLDDMWLTDAACVTLSATPPCALGLVNDPLNSDWGTGLTGSPAIGLTFLTAISASTPAANTTTVSLFNGSNALSSYSAAATSDCSTSDWKSGHGWVHPTNGNIYINVEKQQNSAPFLVCSSTLIISDDLGLHWCNKLTWDTNSHTCPHNSTTATGDAPTVFDATTMLWQGSGPNDSTHYMAFLSPISTGQPGASVPSIPGNCGGTCQLFYNITGDDANIGLARIALTDDPMQAANWHYYSGAPGGDANDPANWTTTLSSATAIYTFAAFNSIPTATWLPDFSKVLVCGLTTGAVSISCDTASSPTGPFLNKSNNILPQVPTGGGVFAVGFPTLLRQTLTTVGPGHDTIVLFTNGPFGSYSGTKANSGYSLYGTLLDILRQ